MTATQERVITNLHNQPPTDEQILQDRLAIDYKKYVDEYDDAVKKESFLPEEIASDEDQGKYSDYDKSLTSVRTDLDAFNKKEKKPHDLKVKIINAFFKTKIESIQAIEKRIAEKMTAYSAKKEETNRRIAKERADAAAREAARLLAEAQEKEREAREAARKAREEAERIQREAQAAAKKAEDEAAAARKKAEDEAAAVRAAAAEEQRKAQAEIDRLRLDAEKDKAALAAAEEAKKQADRDAKQAERDAKATLEAADKEAKSIQKELKADLKEAEAQVAAVQKEANVAAKESNYALEDAMKADKHAVKLDRKADASSSEFNRTRGAMSVSSTSDYWTGHMTDLNTLDLEKLRFHINIDALETAIKSAARAGQRDISGASIYTETRLNNR